MNNSRPAGRYLALRLESSFSKDLGQLSIKSIKANPSNSQTLSNIILETADKFNLPISFIRKKVSAKLFSSKIKWTNNNSKSLCKPSKCLPPQSRNSQNRPPGKKIKISKKLNKRLKNCLRSISK